MSVASAARSRVSLHGAASAVSVGVARFDPAGVERDVRTRRGEPRNQRYGVAGAGGPRPVRAATGLSLPGQRVDLKDLDFALDHRHVADAALIRRRR
ncbi:hypothetical protein ACFRMN_31560 [Streptomyces sp. NPDC056835]|uniref:hypothetical protein n=1 Tax=Streptomyces sp. NPDC056835 TaxID=3345956 RepID=UPI003680F99C